MLVPTQGRTLIPVQGLMIVPANSGRCVQIHYDDQAARGQVKGRGFHSSTCQLNLSALYGIGGARRDCVARVKGVSGGV